MLSEGSIVDRYRIEVCLGRGGMGEVYRAFDPRLRRHVAIKVLHGDRDGERARVLREARTAAALRHPNAIAVHDVGEHEGVCFIVMELLEGSMLREILTGNLPPAATLARWLLSLAEVLEAAHAHGIVHRDVKPENVFIGEDGVLKLLDFGIAKRTGVATDTASLTAEGVVMGTAKYMAPEQLAGLPVDGRADQFAWGIVAYETLARVHPRSLGAEALAPPAALLERHGDAIAPAALAVIVRALSLDPEGRYRSMRALAVAWGQATGQAPTDPGPTKSGSSDAEVEGATRTIDSDRPGAALPLAPVQPQASMPKRRWAKVVGVLAGVGMLGLGVGVALVVATSGERRTEARRAPEHAATPPALGCRSVASTRVPWESSEEDTLSVVRSGNATYATVGGPGAAEGTVRVLTVGDDGAQGSVDVDVTGFTPRSNVSLIELEGQPTLVLERDGRLLFKAFGKGAVQLHGVTVAPRRSGLASIAATSNGVDAIALSVAPEGEGSARGAVARLVWVTAGCHPETALLGSDADGVRLSGLVAVAIHGRLVWTAVQRRDMTTAIARFELTEPARGECRLQMRETATASMLTQPLLVASDAGPALLGHRSRTTVGAVPLGALPNHGLVGLLGSAPGAAPVGSALVAAWVEDTAPHRLRVGRVEVDGVAHPFLDRTPQVMPASVVVASGEPGAVGWLEGRDLRLERVTCARDGGSVQQRR